MVKLAITQLKAKNKKKFFPSFLNSWLNGYIAYMSSTGIVILEETSMPNNTKLHTFFLPLLCRLIRFLCMLVIAQ